MVSRFLGFFRSGKTRPGGTSFHENRPSSLVVFDKDGTLKDFHTSWVPWLESNAKRVCSLLGSDKANQTVESVFEVVGYHPKRDRSLTSDSPLTHASMTTIRELVEDHVGKEAMKGWQDKVCPTQVVIEPVIPHIEKSLSQFRNVGSVRFAVATSDNVPNARSALNHFSIERLFDLVVGCDSKGYLLKPEPQILHRLCDQLSIPYNRCIMVGDTKADMEMARGPSALPNAGAVGVGVLTGIGTAEELKSAGAKFIIKDIGDLHSIYPKILDSLEPPPQEASSSSFAIPRFPERFRRSQLSLAFSNYRSFSTSSEKTNSLPSRKVIVVGGGSAGSIIASRLSEDPKTNVLLLEAGPRDDRPWDWWRLAMPSAMGMNLQNKTFNWGFETTPQENMNNRKITTPRGRVLGGSSSINAMVYLRGNRNDYDEWAKGGATGWSYDECLPFFKKLETYHGPQSEWRGTDGPIRVQRPEMSNPLFKAFVDSGVEAGYQSNPDINGEYQEGFGAFDTNIHNGERMSASRCYVSPAEKKRENLFVETDLVVGKVLVEGKRAVGVEYHPMGNRGKTKRVYGDEIVLSAGAVGSPGILQRSGIGDPELIESLGIEVTHNLKGVGKNLQDHLEVYVQVKSKEPLSLYPYQWSKPHNMVRVGLEWFLRRTGICATNHLEAGAFVKSDDSLEWPNIQFHFLPAAIDDQGSSMKGFGHAFQVHVGPMRSLSRGYVNISSDDPFQDPIIEPNYLSCEQDLVEFRRSVEIARDVFAQDSFAPFVGEEVVPGQSVQSEEEIDSFIREKAESAYHLCGSCKMGGDDDESAVVDQFGRVRGLAGLYVADASIMPTVVTSNLNCPTMMIAEKISSGMR